jgi:hypothetical protein
LSAQGAQPGEPTEDELRAAYEAELSRLTTTDMIAQAVVSLLNIGARRLAPAGADQDPTRPGEHDRGPTHPQQPPPGQRDLAQARDAIDAVRALLEILERSIPQEIAPLRDALSRLQMAYAREVAPGAAAATAGQAAGAPGAEGGPGAEGEPAGEQGDPTGEPGAEERPPGPGPAEASGRLWVPGR